jgi:hypothetical protein
MKYLVYAVTFVVVIDLFIILVCLIGSLAGAALVGHMMALLGFVPPLFIFLIPFMKPSLAGIINIALLIPMFNFVKENWYETQI